MSTSMNLIVRTLDVLQALNKQTHCSLRSLHEATGIPKPTVHRLLQTLKNEGYVRSDIAKGIYSLTEKVRLLSEGYTECELVVELGGPILRRITRSTGLPLAIGIAERGQIVVRCSSMPYSPIGPSHTTIGNAHEMTVSAMGLAFLAFCNADERTNLVKSIEQASDPAEWKASSAKLRADITLVRKRGFALRQPSPQHPSTTLAVPIQHQKQILGVLSLTTFPSLLKRGTAITDFTRTLIEASQEISKAVAAHQGGTAGASPRKS
ncbi:helix-turn-helix domain-containing protein [Candidimonas nitroreducens]|uniref:IclR family transcriptional regulator n=1 Tax=Candidimonas nitroreducens TaxID=683354 RepID=A0A225N4A7_9BURK|nr:helix-turn-helix domain-containing protein [Candidimonas nitroreducens]OWT65849.1 hypothetical protein CEY11_03740 [Candidimonas nitroreducens]